MTQPALRAAHGTSLENIQTAPIGVFDSGIGGLSVWRHLRTALPFEDFIYLADTAHVPYGDKSEVWIQSRMIEVVKWFLAKNCKTIVIACNTATAAAGTFLRGLYPDLFIVGLEPAIKPALLLTKNRTIAMLATARTVGSAKYAALLERAVLPELDMTVLSIPCIGLAERIDAGLMDTEETRALIATYISPVKAAQADVVVLGCTHYPFVVQQISALLGKNVQIIDSGAPVARYTRDVLTVRNGLNPQKITAKSEWYTTQKGECRDDMWRLLSGVVDVQVQQIDI